MALNDESVHLDEPTLDRLRTGELDAPARERAEAHLAVCARCAGVRAELEAFARAIERGYAEERTAAAEPDWNARRATILAATSGRSAGRRWARWIPQAAAVLVAVVAVGVLVERGVRGPEDAGRVVEAPVRAPAERARPEPETAEEIEAPAVTPEAGGPPAGARSELDEIAGGREPAPAPPAAPAPEAPDEVGRANEARPAREAAAEELLRQRRAEVAPDEDAAKAALEAEVVAPLERYFAVGRAALARQDPTAARAALSLWSDTLAPGGVAPAAAAPARADSAAALADSLAAFLGGPPE